ncbi:MAG: 4Fe-4S dicluster domain-containing protein [Solirubrobacteraceae bacterium]
MTPANGATPRAYTGTRSAGPSLFIDVEVTPEVASDPAKAAKLTEVCPVDIYAQHDDGTLRIVEPNLDECVLCRLCIDASPPGTVTVRKLYDGGAAL